MSVGADTTPPQNIEAEESVLGAMLVAAPALDRVIDGVRLNATDFYLEKHQANFECIRSLYRSGRPVDELTVSDELTKLGRLEIAGGRPYVSELAARVPAAANAKHYAEIVQQNSLLRRLLGAGQEIQRSVYERNGELPVDLYQQAEELLTTARPSAIGLPVRAADLGRVRPIRWLWKHRLPIGYLSLLLGAEGVGKGTLGAWLIARITRGELPGDLDSNPARVLLVGDEDAFDSVVVPRLYAAGADLDLVATLAEEDGGDYLDVARDAERLRALVTEHRYKLVYLDSLLDMLGVDVDDWRSKAVRDALRPLRRVARDVEVTMLGSLHPNKGQRGSFRDLVSGSHAFNASSRSSLLLAPHPEDEDRRILVRGKGNLSAAPPAFEFSIRGRELEINDFGFSLPVVAEEAESDLGIEDVVKPQREAPVRESLADEINALGTGEIQTRAELARALGREPDDRSIGRALDQLEDQGRWEKVGRGKWRTIGIGTSKEAPMSKTPEAEDLFGDAGSE